MFFFRCGRPAGGEYLFRRECLNGLERSMASTQSMHPIDASHFPLMRERDTFHAGVNECITKNTLKARAPIYRGAGGEY
jgi:hypothetical protein